MLTFRWQSHEVQLFGHNKNGSVSAHASDFKRWHMEREETVGTTFAFQPHFLYNTRGTPCPFHAWISWFFGGVFWTFFGLLLVFSLCPRWSDGAFTIPVNKKLCLLQRLHFLPFRLKETERVNNEVIRWPFRQLRWFERRVRERDAISPASSFTWEPQQMARLENEIKWIKLHVSLLSICLCLYLILLYSICPHSFLAPFFLSSL